MDVSEPGGPEGEGAAPGAPDLSPRRTTDVTAVARAPKRRKAWGAGIVLALVLSAAGILLYQGLSSATVYFCNADEVGRKAGCDDSGRFRLQGTVDNGSLEELGGTLLFTVTYNGSTIPVRYQGEPGGIFREGIPVVVEGRLRAVTGSGAPTTVVPSGGEGTGTGMEFAGDRILVKHTEQYVEENPDRVPEGAP